MPLSRLLSSLNSSYAFTRQLRLKGDRFVRTEGIDLTGTNGLEGRPKRGSNTADTDGTKNPKYRKSNFKKFNVRLLK